MSIKKWLLLVLLSGQALAYEMEDIKQINFEVQDPKTKEVYYSGHEEIVQEGNSIRKDTRYFDANKKEVQFESVTFDRNSLKISRYEYRNGLTGEESQIEASPEEAKISYRPETGKAQKSSSVKLDKASLHGKVINNLILRNWKALTSGKLYRFNLLLPSRMELIPFQVLRRKSYTLGEEKREVFALIPQNILVKALAPHLEFEYSSGEKPLLRQFLCPSPLPIKGRKDRMVNFVFTYPQLQK